MVAQRRLLAACSIVLSLGVGLGLFYYGLTHSQILPLRPWAAPGVWRFAVFTGVFAVLAAAVLLSGPRRRGPWLVAVLLFWLTAAFGLGAMAAVALLGAGALALGDLLFGVGWRTRFGLATAGLLALATGLALLAWVIGLTAHAPGNLPAVYLAVLALLVLAGLRRLALYAQGFRAWLAETTVGPAGYVGLAVLVFVLALQGLFAAMPEQYYDALAVHLLVSTTLAAHGQWHFDASQLMTAVGPMGADWLFAAGYLLGGESAAKLVNLGLLAAITGLVGVEVGRRHGAQTALWTMAVFASLPLTFIETASLFSENALALFGLAATIVILRAWTEILWSDAVAVAVLTAGAALVKLHGVFFIVPCCGWVLAVMIRQGRTAQVLPALLAGLVIMAPPYLYSWISTGNPLFPYFNAVFKSPLWPAENFSDPLYTGKLTWDLLYRWTFHSADFIEGYDGALGFAPLVLLLAGLAALLTAGDRPLLFTLLVSGVYLLGVTPFSQYLRYFYPVLPLAALFTAGIVRLGPLLGPPPVARGVGALLVLLALGLVGFDLRAVPAAGWILDNFEPMLVLDRSRQAEWLSQWVPARRFVEAVNALASDKSRVLFIGAPAGSGLLGTPLYYNWYNLALVHELNRANTPDAAGHVLQHNHVTHVIISAGKPDHPQVLAYLERSAKLIGNNGVSSLYEVLPDPALGDERINNGTFESGFTAWDINGQVTTNDRHQALIPARGSIDQAVPVAAGETLIHAVRVACAAERTDFQLQVNWLNAGGTILNTQIDTHACPPGEEPEVMVRRVAPADAVFGFFYINVLTGPPLTVNRVSVKSQ